MEKKRTPRLRFRGFTDDWEQRKLGDFGYVAMCKRIFKDQTAESGDIPFYKIGTFGGEPDAYISRDLFEEYKHLYSYPEKGDILISASGSIGRTVEYTGEDAYYQDSNIVWLKHDKTIVNSFLKHLYEVIRWSGIEGSTIKRLYNDNILRTEVMIPAAPEQERIGKCFNNLDNLITLHQRKYDMLKKVKKAMFEKMFPKNGKRVPEIRFAGFTDDWEQRKLSNIADIVGGGTPSTSNPDYWDGDIDWYTPAEIGEQIFANGSVRKITKDGLNHSSAKILPAHKTVLFTSRAGIGSMAILQRLAATNQGFQSLVCHDDIDPYFVFSMGDSIKTKAERVAAGSTFAEISGKKLGDLELMFPSTDEQKAIGNYFKNLDNLITLHQRKLEKLNKLKKSMLEEIFV